MPDVVSPAAAVIPIQRIPSRPADHNGSLVVEGLVVEAANRKRLIDRVGFVVPTGTMLAIAGPTGAGKTTLARAITGAIALSAGSILVGGREVATLDPSRRGIGYVPQEDSLHPELSVRRTLGYAAALRMPGCDAADLQQRVEQVLGETRLTAQADQVVGSLSVGQRKRVCIASELLSEPAVLVLDEPTSSLDPGYEAIVMTTLRRLADSGHAIVIVTHSQAAIAGCDRVVLLSSGGRLAYFGSPEHMHSKFDTETAAELFAALDEAEPAVLLGHPSMTRSSGEAPTPPVGPEAGRTTGRRQLSILTRRYVDLTFADRRRSLLFALQGVLLGLVLIAFVTPDELARPTGASAFGVPFSATGIAVLLVMCVTWLGTSSGVREIVKERHILVREHRAGLSAAAYVGSKIAVLWPLLLAQSAIVTLLAVQRQSVPGHGAVLPGVVEIFVATALAGISAVTVALFVSATVRSADKALAVLPMLVVMEFVLSGLTPTVSWVPGLAQLRDLAGTRWAVQAIQATVTGDSHSWWTAVVAMAVLTLLALAGTFAAVHHSLRLPAARAPRRSPAAIVRSAVVTFNPEMIRLSRIGGSCLAAVALIATGARIVAPLGAGAAAPLAVSAASAPVDSNVSTAATPASSQSIASDLPGVLGGVWWMLDTGTRVGIGATEAAYLASSRD
jgi:ABC-type multidrug transport system ATPase subunit